MHDVVEAPELQEADVLDEVIHLGCRLCYDFILGEVVEALCGHMKVFRDIPIGGRPTCPMCVEVQQSKTKRCGHNV